MHMYVYIHIYIVFQSICHKIINGPYTNGAQTDKHYLKLCNIRFIFISLCGSFNSGIGFKMCYVRKYVL